MLPSTLWNLRLNEIRLRDDLKMSKDALLQRVMSNLDESRAARLARHENGADSIDGPLAITLACVRGISSTPAERAQKRIVEEAKLIAKAMAKRNRQPVQIIKLRLFASTGSSEVVKVRPIRLRYDRQSVTGFAVA